MSLPRSKVFVSLCITFAVLAVLILVALRWPFIAAAVFIGLVVLRAASIGRKRGFSSGLGVFLKEILFGW
jgi:hypothetical protein